MLRTLIISLLLTAHQAYAVDLIAHRGYACAGAENSVESVRRAWRAGADGVEVDVRVSSDGIVILYHDDKILDSKIDELPYSDIVSLSAEPISTLSQVLAATNGDGYYVLDLKTTDIVEVDAILDVVRASSLSAESVSFQSDSIDSLNHIRRRMPTVRLTYLSRLKWRIPYILRPSANHLVKAIDGHNIDRVSIKGRSFLNRRFIDTIKATGRDVHVWTINDRQRARYYQGLGVDGLITDRVEGLLPEGDGHAYRDRECP